MSSTSRSSGTSAPTVRIAKEVYRKRTWSLLQKLVLAFLGSVVILYVLLAMTLMRALPSPEGPLWVKNMTYKGGMAPSGAQVTVDTKAAVKHDPSHRLLQAVTYHRSAAVVEVLAGPFGAVAGGGTQVKVDGRVVAEGAVAGLTSDKKFLQNEYLVRCLSGACAAQSLLLVPADHIYGQALTMTTEA